RWRDLLHAAGSADHHRKLASSLQHRAAACLDRLPGSGTGGVRASTRRMAGCAIPTSSAGHAPAGAKADPKLTFHPDHLVGAGQDHRVIAFDRPGFGHSERPRNRIWTAEAQADLLWRALCEIAVHRPVIVGHSWGALVAIAMALRDQADTAGLSLLSGLLLPKRPARRGDDALAGNSG